MKRVIAAIAFSVLLFGALLANNADDAKKDSVKVQQEAGPDGAGDGNVTYCPQMFEYSMYNDQTGQTVYWYRCEICHDGGDDNCEAADVCVAQPYTTGGDCNTIGSNGMGCNGGCVDEITAVIAPPTATTPPPVDCSHARFVDYISPARRPRYVNYSHWWYKPGSDNITAKEYKLTVVDSNGNVIYNNGNPIVFRCVRINFGSCEARFGWQLDPNDADPNKSPQNLSVRTRNGSGRPDSVADKHHHIVSSQPPTNSTESSLEFHVVSGDELVLNQ
jgi:hypothetical protein